MKKIFLAILWVLPSIASAQYGYITGKVYDKFGPLGNANVSILDSPYGTFTDSEGYFAFELDTGFYTLEVRHTGFNTIQKSIILYDLDQKELDFELEGALLSADVSLGSKSEVTQNQLESPVPIDVIYGEDLIKSGHAELTKALNHLLPNFYAVQQSSADGSNFVESISLRGLSPDQVLILVNGKRRHKSAFLHSAEVFGKGSAGTDLNAIPMLAIDRIEVLRDGASSQYGSDAIAGVINIILKKTSGVANVLTNVGISKEGDGLTKRAEFNYGFKVKRRGYINLTGSFMDSESVNRSGEYTGPIYGTARDNLDQQRANFFAQTGFDGNRVAELGNAAISSGSLIFNSNFEMTEDMDVYAFGGVTFKEGKSREVYRFPFDETAIVPQLYPDGFSPQLRSEILDKSIVIGVRGNVGEWLMDVSYNRGHNLYELSVQNSNNASLGRTTPIATYAGGYLYDHDVLSFDGSRSFIYGESQFDLAIGGGYRIEQYDILEGQAESYAAGTDSTSAGIPRAVGMQGYFGVSNNDQLEELRSNISVYLDGEYSFRDKLLVGGAFRAESYSDFGENYNFKLAGRYKIANPLLIRASYSTGFKAPSLQQLYYSRISTVLIEGDEASGLVNKITFNSEHPITRTLELDDLEPEIAKNYSFGITSSINRNVSLSFDTYRVDVDNRITLSSSLDIRNRTVLNDALGLYGVGLIDFFTNAVNTRTEGFDGLIAAQFDLNRIGELKLSGGYSMARTRIRGDVITRGLIRQQSNIELLDRSDLSKMETYVPTSQLRTSASLSRKGFSLTISNTRFGESTYLHPEDADQSNWEINEFTGQRESRDQTFSAKNILDIEATVKLKSKMEISLGAINVLNAYPDKQTHSGNVVENVNIYNNAVRHVGLLGAYYYTRVFLRL